MRAKAMVCISGIGKYTGTLKAYYYIVPAKPKLSAVSNAEGTVDLSWSGDEQADGYQLIASSDRSFSTKKTYIIKDKNKTSGIVCGLRSGRTFYVRIRSYKIIDGKKIPGVPSDIISVVTK